MAESVLDVVGVGFGPSNLALAIALEETGLLTRARFVERQPRFGWHRDMLIEGTTMQVAFLKDLVTMRNPVSRYGYVPYLHAKGRLVDFVNTKTLFPLRVEFHDYLEWVAADFESSVDYGTEVVAIRPVDGDGDVVDLLDVVVRNTGDGATTTLRTRNVVIATGLEPHLPPGITPSQRIWHSSALLRHTPWLAEGHPTRLVVVGAGQSAAEVTAHLHDRFPGAEICAVFARYGYSAADDSPFANKVFDPEAVDVFHGAPEEVRRDLGRYHANTNYSVVDVDLIEDLARRAYLADVVGKPWLRVMRTSRAKEVAESAGVVRVAVEHLPDRSVTELRADAVVFATGYRPSNPMPLLKDVAWACKQDDGALVLERDYRVLTSEMLRCGIYVHGAAAEATHGITAGLLSTTAVRAGEITSSIGARLSSTLGT